MNEIREKPAAVRGKQNKPHSPPGLRKTAENPSVNAMYRAARIPSGAKMLACLIPSPPNVFLRPWPSRRGCVRAETTGEEKGVKGGGVSRAEPGSKQGNMQPYGTRYA